MKIEFKLDNKDEEEAINTLINLYHEKMVALKEHLNNTERLLKIYKNSLAILDPEIHEKIEKDFKRQ